MDTGDNFFDSFYNKLFQLDENFPAKDRFIEYCWLISSGKFEEVGNFLSSNETKAIINAKKEIIIVEPLLFNYIEAIGNAIYLKTENNLLKARLEELKNIYMEELKNV